MKNIYNGALEVFKDDKKFGQTERCLECGVQSDEKKECKDKCRLCNKCSKSGWHKHCGSCRDHLIHKGFKCSGCPKETYLCPKCKEEGKHIIRQ